MIHIFSKNESIQEYTKRELIKEIRKESKGRIPADVREELARRTVDRMDFSNSIQMHKSLRGYAEILVQNYYHDRVISKRSKLTDTDNVDRSYFELEAAAISQHIYISDYIRGLIASAMRGKLPPQVIDSIIDDVDKLQYHITEEIADDDEQIRAIADVLEYEYTRSQEDENCFQTVQNEKIE